MFIKTLSTVTMFSLFLSFTNASYKVDSVNLSLYLKKMWVKQVQSSNASRTKKIAASILLLMKL